MLPSGIAYTRFCSGESGSRLQAPLELSEWCVAGQTPGSEPTSSLVLSWPHSSMASTRPAESAVQPMSTRAARARAQAV